MKHLLLLFASLSMLTIQSSRAQSWESIVTDPIGDGFDPNLLDATELLYLYKPQTDSIYFRIDVTGWAAANPQTVGINVMINIPGYSPKFNFWGSDNMNNYHKLVTVWVTGSPPASYTGVIGVSDSVGIANLSYNNLGSNNVSIKVDVNNNYLLIGMKREDLITDAEMGGSKVTLGAAGAVGSNAQWNDDLWSSTATMTIDKGGATGLISTPDLPSVLVFPTYSSGNVSVQFGTKMYNTLQIYNANGQLVKNIQLGANSSFNFDLPTQKGMYFLSFVDEEGEVVVEKVVRQ